MRREAADHPPRPAPAQLPVVIGKGEFMEIAVLQTLRPPALDALHERPPFPGGLPLPLGLLLAGG